MATGIAALGLLTAGGATAGAAIPAEVAALGFGTGAAATTATAGSSFLGLSSAAWAGASAIASGGTALYQSYASGQASKVADAQLKMQAKAVEIQSVKDEADRRQQLLNALSSRSALFASRGIALGEFGTPETLTNADLTQLNNANRIGGLNTQMSLNDTRLQRSANSLKSTYGFISGFGKGASSLLDYGYRRSNLDSSSFGDGKIS